jgi:hypothetical protein
MISFTLWGNRHHNNKNGPRRNAEGHPKKLKSLKLDDANLVSLRSLWALGDVEFDSLIFIE